MWGILKKNRRLSVAALCSLVLLVASVAPCNCLALGSGDNVPADTQKQHSENSHPCGSHDKSDSKGSDEGANHDHNESHSDGCDSNCCCSGQLPTALADAQTFVKSVSIEVDEPLLLPPIDSFLGGKTSFATLIQMFPRGSPGGGILPFIIRSSSTLSVRLQRWLI